MFTGDLFTIEFFDKSANLVWYDCHVFNTVAEAEHHALSMSDSEKFCSSFVIVNLKTALSNLSEFLNKK